MVSLLRGLFLCQVGWLNTTLRLICVLYKGNMIKLWKKNITNRYLQHHQHCRICWLCHLDFPLIYIINYRGGGGRDLSRFIHIKFCLSVVNINKQLEAKWKSSRRVFLLIKKKFLPKSQSHAKFEIKKFSNWII